MATGVDKKAYSHAQAALRAMFAQITEIEAEVQTYEQIKIDLAAARATFRALTAKFVDELKTRCASLTDDQKQQLVVELFAQDVQIGLDVAVGAKRQAVVRALERLWD